MFQSYRIVRLYPTKLETNLPKLVRLVQKLGKFNPQKVIVDFHQPGVKRLLESQPSLVLGNPIVPGLYKFALEMLFVWIYLPAKSFGIHPLYKDILNTIVQN